MKKEDLKQIVINLLSSLIWELVIGLVSVVFTIPLAKHITNKLVNVLSGVNVNSTLVAILLFLLMETIIISIVILLKKVLVSKQPIEPQPIGNPNDGELKDIETCVVEEDDLPKLDYYFEDYIKHVTIYKNGNGIIMNTFNICVNNLEKFREFKRKINVEDGKKDLSFPTLSKMKSTSKDKRFEEFGFWIYKPADSIVSSTVERYWSDNDPDEIDHISQHNDKELRWVFEINRSKLKEKKVHRISYALSVPGLYPIEKGKFVETVANQPEASGKASTSIHVEHYIKKITYILSFEEGIKLIKEPEGFTINGTRLPITDFYIEEGVFYNKYIFTINEPSYGTSVVLKWQFAGGNDMDKESGD